MKRNIKILKYLFLVIATLTLLYSCKHNHGIENEEKSEEKIEDYRSSDPTNFPVIGFRKVHEEIIPFPLKKVFPLFEPQGRYLLYDNWNPTILKEGKEGSLLGQIEFSKYDDLDVILKVTEHNPDQGHIQYLAIWDNFEIQHIDIFCKEGSVENTTELKWIEHNAGLYQKGVSLVSKFVKEGYLVQAVERYTSNIEKQLSNE